MTQVTCKVTANYGISSGTLRSVIEYGLPLPFFTLRFAQSGWANKRTPDQSLYVNIKVIDKMIQNEQQNKMNNKTLIKYTTSNSAQPKLRSV